MTNREPQVTIVDMVGANMTRGEADQAAGLKVLLDQALKSETLGLRFPEALEARFEADTLMARQRQLRLVGSIGMVFYGLFLFLDAQVAPDIFFLAEEVRAGIVVIGLLLFVIVFRLEMPQWLREALAGVSTLLALSGLMLLFFQTNSSDRIAYVNGTVLVVLYGTICVPARFAVAVAVTVMSAVIIAGGVLISSLSIPTKDAQLAISFTLILLTLLTAYRLEKGQRRTYLLCLRETLRNADLMAKNDRLRILSERDGLTNLVNRRALDLGLEERIANCRQAGLPLGMIMLDVDHFKKFNDHYGHPAGDDCLRKIAAILRGQVRREADLVGRYGGEEFLIVLPELDLTGCIRVAQRIRRMIEQAAIPHSAPGVTSLVVTASFGVAAISPLSDVTSEALVRMADEQLYAAKQAGRNRVSPSFVLAAGSTGLEMA